MTRTPARKNPAFGWNVPIPRRLGKLARIAAALSLTAVTVLTVAIPSASAAAVARAPAYGTQPVGGGQTVAFTQVLTLTAGDDTNPPTWTATLINNTAVTNVGTAVATLSGGGTTGANVTACTVTSTTSSQCAVTGGNSTDTSVTFTGLKVNNAGVYRLNTTFAAGTGGDDTAAALQSGPFVITGATFGSAMVATDATLTGVQPSTSVVPGVALATPPTVVVVGTNAAHTVSLSLVDTSGNAVSPTQATLTSSSTTGTFTPAGGAADPTKALACANNVCTLAGTLASNGGTFQFPGLKISNTGSFKLKATDSVDTATASTAQSSTINVAFSGTPFRLAYTTAPGNGFGGAALQTQPAVTLYDSAGNVVTGANGNVIFSLNDFGGQSLPATAVILSQAGTACPNNACSVALVGGVASPALSIDTELNVDQSRGYSIYSLSAAADPTLVTSAGVVQGAISSQFQLMTGPPSKIANKSAPVGAAKTQNFQGPTVELDDAGGNPQFQDKTSTNAIQVLDATSQSAPTNGAVLVGTTQLTLSAPAGSTTFRNLSITQDGDYLLRVTSSAGVPTLDIGTGMTAITDPGFATMQATNSGNPVASTDTSTAGKDYIKALKNKAGPKQPFMIRDNQLVVTAPSTAAVIGQPLPPITVSLVDSSGVIQNTNAPVLLRLSISSVDTRPAFPAVVAPAYQNATSPNTVGGLGCNTDFLTVGCPILQGNLVAGTVTFSGLTVPAASGAGRYTFTAEMGKDNTTSYIQGMVTCTSYVGVTSTNTNTASSGCTGQLGTVAPGKASGILTLDKQLIFTSQPVGADAGKALTTNPVVVLADGFGNTVTSDSYHSGTISLGDSAGKADKSGAKLTGSGCATDGASCTVPFSSGAGVFNAISIDLPGTYTLVGSTNAWANNGYAPANITSASFTIGGTAVTPAGGGAASTVPTLPASTTPPPSTDLTAIYASIPALKDIKTANVSWSYLGPSAVVVSLLTPPLWTTTFPVGCYSGPNATSSEASGAVLFATKPAGTDFILFFIRGTRAYSFDVAFGNYCWIDLIAA